MSAPLSRSEQMSRIRGKDTEPEMRMRSLLWASGARYRLHRRVSGTRPDLVFVGARLAVFVDGCFWHGCPDHYAPPRTRREFWQRKLAGNVERDRLQTQFLGDEGWQVLRFWEHEVFQYPDKVVQIIMRALTGARIRRGRQPRVSEVEFLDADGQLEKRHLVPLRGEEHLGFEVRERRTTKWKAGR